MGNILCEYNEYRYENGKWISYAKATYRVTLNYIENMVEASACFPRFGGYMNVCYGKSKAVKKIVSVSICGTIKKVFKFKYN